MYALEQFSFNVCNGSNANLFDMCYWKRLATSNDFEFLRECAIVFSMKKLHPFRVVDMGGRILFQVGR